MNKAGSRKLLTISTLWNGAPALASEAVTLGLRIEPKGHLTIDIDAPFYNDPRPPNEPGRTWKLWEHEVVELFLVGPNGHYVEAEFGPFGHWLVLGLDGVRSIANSGLKPRRCEARIEGSRWYAKASISRGVLPSSISRFNAYAIHGSGINRRYLAYGALPGDEPDFHQPHYFPDWAN